jgi:putative inorganic carbon (hco3(-)) transporter
MIALKWKILMKIIYYCNRIIEFSFYSLFLLVPLVFSGNTSELYELNKMWLTWAITLVVATAWITKMIVEKQFRVQRTILDIPILLFLLSNILSTLFSLDSHVSFWGYYSRFNGGLLSFLSYIFLYYAFVTHFNKEHTKRLLQVILLSGLLVVLWGIPSHFGKDPTCLMFRGTFDVSCWTDAFRPTERTFSTLGQPAWLAAFLAVLIPLAMAKFLELFKAHSSHKEHSVSQIAQERLLSVISYTLLADAFYLCLLYANTRAGFLGFWIANIAFWFMVFFKKIFSPKHFLILFFIINSQFAILNFFNYVPMSFLDRFTYHALFPTPASQTTQSAPQTKQVQTMQDSTDTGGVTDSGKIRLNVWKGAVDAWKANPILGTGVETYAFAYYKYKPVEHNLTSEWDFLYNKAHNEYLNYLATTGILGLGTYITMIVFFLWSILAKKVAAISHNSQTIRDIRETHDTKSKQTETLIIGLLCGYLSILVTNFFGFSVVIINLFLLLIPAFVFILNQSLNPKHAITFPNNSAIKQFNNVHITVSQWFGISIVCLTTFVLLFTLYRYWEADKAYGLGSNLAHAGVLQDAYPQLKNAVDIWPSEPIFQDELSIVSAQLAQGLFEQKEAKLAAGFAQQAVETNARVLEAHPNNVVFWKSRIRIFYSLAQIDGHYLPYALQAGEEAAKLAPTDAKIWYNLAVLYGQNDQVEKAISLMHKTLEMKPDYTDARYALGLFYRDAAIDKNGRVTKPDLQQKAVDAMQYILQNQDPENKDVKKALQEWSQ